MEMDDKKGQSTMRLIIREYLAPMRESGELDALLPDLLLSMGVVPISKPKVGARQYGVDIAGVGKDLTREKERLKAFRLLNLCVRIIFQWAREEDNLKPALQAAERTVLNVWGWMHEEGVREAGNILPEFLKIYDTYLSVARAYHSKVRPACQVEDGLYGFSAAEEIEYPLRVYEQIGICSLAGLNEWYLVTLSNASGNEEMASQHSQIALTIANDLAGLISNNGPAFNPPYDEHVNEIELGLLLFALLDRKEDAIRWITEMINRIEFAFTQLGRRFPVYRSSYETLVELEVGEAEPQMPSSTLFTALAEWAVVLQRADLYEHIRKVISRTFSETDLQVWYPDEETKENLYRQNASGTGTIHTSISLPEDFEAFKEFIVQERKKEDDAPLYSAVEQNLVPLELLASRHFRTPLHPRIRRDLMELPGE
jgi:hypothetical protein